MENQNNNNNNRNPDNKRKVFWSITTILLIIIIVVGGLLIFLLLNNKNKQVSDSGNNVSQDTLLFKQTDIVPFKDKIEANKWTTDEFKPNYQSLGLKTFTQNNLTVDGNSIRQLIDQVYPLSNTKIQINLSEFANIKYLISTDVDRELSYLVQNLLYIDGIDANFITGIRLTKLNAIYSAINNYINDSTRKYTFSEFQKDVNDNNEWFKTYVSDYLYISDVEKINPQHIKKVGFDANNNFTIELENEEVKYYIDVVDKNDDVTLNGNVLTIGNLKYYDVEIIDETNLNQLKDNVQSFIEANQISASQFPSEIDKNTFKSAVANYLNIKTTSIGNAIFNNSVLKISPASRIKFRVKTNNDTTSNLIDNNGDIRVANLTFFNSITLYNLDKLYIAINNYINESNNQFTPEEFRDDFKNPTSLTRIRNEVFDNLYTSSSSTLAKDKVIDISLDKLNRLAITLDTDYTKYDISGQYNNVYFDNDGIANNSKLVIDNLQYWKNITVSDANLNNLQTRIQSYINTKGYTKETFTSDVSKTAFKSEIMNYLNITDTNSISKISFENDVLEIVPVERNKFISPLNSNLIVNNNIQVSGFSFFTVSNITNLDKLWEATNDYIINPTRKLTSDEFRVKLVDDKDFITSTLADNIDIVLNNTRAIDKTKIINLVLNSNNELEITLDPNSVKYQLSSTNLNVSLNGNKLIVKNLKFYNAVNITTDKLNSLQNNIQSYIDTKELTETSFVDTTNSSDFRISVINYLGVNNGDVINTISYNTRNKVLTITPTDNDKSRNKFTSTNNSNLIVNNNIEVSGFNFFNITTLSNTDKLTGVVNAIITSEDNKFTTVEFKKYITDNLETFKNTIANNIDISWNEKLNPNKIQNVQLNDSNQLVVTLDPTYAKYELFAKNANIELVNNQLFINNLTFYTEINVSDENLNNMQKAIQKYITDNSIMDGSNNLTSDDLMSLIKDIKVEDNKEENIVNMNLSSYIREVSIQNKSVTFALKDFVKMSNKALDDVIVNENSIQINNLIFAPSDNYFTWDSETPTKITGLTSLGKQQTKIVIPEKATEISDSVFSGDTKIEEVDLSKSKIATIPNGWAGDGLFYGCSNLKIVILPSDLTYIGTSAFMNCSSLNTIKLPTTPEGTNNELPITLKTIGDQAFRGCSSLSEITFPSSVTSLGKSSFNGSGLINVIVPETIKEVKQNAFQNCKFLETVKLFSPITTITSYTFANCPNLTTVGINKTVTDIDYYAFKESPNVILEVPTQAMKDKFDNENILSLNPNKIKVNESLNTTTPDLSENGRKIKENKKHHR